MKFGNVRYTQTYTQSKKDNLDLFKEIELLMSKGATLVAGVSSATMECFILISQLVSKIPRLWCYFLSYINDSFLNFT